MLLSYPCRATSHKSNLKLARFERRILLKFRPTDVRTPHEQWLSTTQTTTVTEYQKKFIELAGPLKDVPESIMLGPFLSGEEEIKTERNRVAGLKRGNVWAY